MKKEQKDSYVVRHKNKQMIFIWLSLFFVIAVLFFATCSLIPKEKEEETTAFLQSKADFEMINNYILENFEYKTYEKNKILGVYFNDDKTVYLNDSGIIEISKELTDAFNHIHQLFNGYDFSHIEIKRSRISYGGLGYRMYVFSRNGFSPVYYYWMFDGMHPNVYTLGNNWYLLEVNFR